MVVIRRHLSAREREIRPFSTYNHNHNIGYELICDAPLLQQGRTNASLSGWRRELTVFRVPWKRYHNLQLLLQR